MDESSPESLFRVVGWRRNDSCAVLKGGMTAWEATAWFVLHANLAEFIQFAIESEQEWPPNLVPDAP